MSSKERVRYVDVGARIGRKLEREEAKDKDEQNFADLHMRRVELRGKGDEELARANAMVQESMEMRMMDTVPYLPGQWTLQLHERIMHRLEESGIYLDAAESTYQQAGAKDKLSSVQQVRETLAALAVKNEKLKEWHERLEEAEQEVQEAARLGMPWGAENFVRARERMEETKRHLKVAGEDGLD